MEAPRSTPHPSLCIGSDHEGGGVCERRLARHHPREDRIREADRRRFGGHKRPNVRQEAGDSNHAKVDCLATRVWPRQQQHPIRRLGLARSAEAAVVRHKLLRRVQQRVPRTLEVELRAIDDAWADELVLNGGSREREDAVELGEDLPRAKGAAVTLFWGCAAAGRAVCGPTARRAARRARRGPAPRGGEKSRYIHAASIEVERGMKPAAQGGGRDATRGRASARGCRRTCRRGRRTFRHGAAEEEGAEQGRRQGGAALRSLEEAFALFVELQREAGRLEIALDILRLLWSHLGESVAGRRRCRGPRSLRRDVAPQWQARLWHRHLEHKAELRDEDDVELVVERVLRHQ